MRIDEIYELEVAMWESARDRDSKAFLNLVSDDAVMVCGGYRCTGKEYAEIISFFDCKCYNIINFEVVSEDSSSVQVHYIITIEVNDEKNIDLAGKFHITTTWNFIDEKWKVVDRRDGVFGFFTVPNGLLPGFSKPLGTVKKPKTPSLMVSISWMGATM